MHGKSVLLAWLQQRDTLTDEEKNAITALPVRVVSIAANEDFIMMGSRASVSCLLLEGFAARVQYLQSGKRQITAVHVAGDFVDLHAFLLKIMDHSVMSLGLCKVAFVEHTDLEKLTLKLPHLARLLWLSTVIDGAIQRAWITCLGRRSTLQHLAHLICELYLRLEVVGLAEKGSFTFPITQEQLGDALGLSTVHVNRTLQDLRATGLVQWRGTSVTITDFEKLASLAEFDPLYLQLNREPR